MAKTTRPLPAQQTTSARETATEVGFHAYVLEAASGKLIWDGGDDRFPSSAARQCRDRLRGLLLANGEVREQLSASGPIWVVMRLSMQGDRSDRAIDSVVALDASLKSVLQRAMHTRTSGQRRGAAVEVVWSETGTSPRQISARVVITGDLASAMREAERRDLDEETERKIEQLRDAVKSVIATLPHDYERLRDGLHAVHDAVRLEIGRALESALNEEARSKPMESYEDKKSLAKWINSELRRVGLALRDRKSGHAALLFGSSGGDPSIGRFALDYTDENGRRIHAQTSVALPQLEVALDPLERAPYGLRTDRSR